MVSQRKKARGMRARHVSQNGVQIDATWLFAAGFLFAQIAAVILAMKL